jgi:hypothetical protein
MQQSEERDTYTPTDIPHIRSNCGLPLNREETLSVSGLKTSSNAPMRPLLVSDCSRTGLASPCCKNSLYLTGRKRYPVIVKTGTIYGAGYAHPYPFG